MKVHYPPAWSPLEYRFSMFLAGSIELDTAENWQQLVILKVKKMRMKVDVFNPRRKAWDSSWPQRADFPQFREQVRWELDHLEHSDIKLFYIDPKTKSPITLLELGLCAPVHADQIVVCCPETFWRAGNVELVCERYKIKLVRTFDDMIDEVKRRYEKKLTSDYVWSIPTAIA